jgi:hypothetical protein
MPGILNFSKVTLDLTTYPADAGLIYQGEDRSFDITITSGGSPVDLSTIISITALLKASREEGEPTLATWAYGVPNQIIPVDLPNGVIGVRLLAAHTALYTFECAVYDMKFLFASGAIRYYLMGDIVVMKRVTT